MEVGERSAFILAHIAALSTLTDMSTNRESLLNRLKLAEQQFRLACTIHLAIANDVLNLDVPVEWSFGRHSVSYEDFGLRRDQAPLAGMALEETAMLVLVSAIRDAIVGSFPNPKQHADRQVFAAYQISRLIRNAFAHSMIDPIWSIDSDCIEKTFTIEGIISVCTTGLHGRRMGWADYGGPLAIFLFGRFVRETLLQDQVDPNRTLPAFPNIPSYQAGRTVFRRVERVPPDAIRIATLSRGESFHLGEDFVLCVPRNEAEDSKRS